MFSIHSDNGNAKRTRVMGDPLKGAIQTDGVENVDIFDGDDSDDDHAKRVSTRSGGNGYSEDNPSVPEGASTGTARAFPVPATVIEAPAVVGSSPQFGGANTVAVITGK